MWTYEHSLETDATPESIFALYRDVSGWPEWDAGLERAELDGPFVSGSTGTVVVTGQGAFGFRLTTVEEGRRFEDETAIPGAGIVVRFDHVLDPLPGGGTKVTQTVTIDGPAAATMGPAMGPGITADTPEAMAALVGLAAGRLAGR